MTETLEQRGRVCDLKIVQKSSNIEEYRAMMHERVDKICDSYLEYDGKNSNIAAMAIVVIGKDGSFNVSKNVEENIGFGGILLPAIVSEAMRMAVAEDIAIDVFNGMRT